MYLPLSVAGLAVGLTVGLAVGFAAEIYNLFVIRICLSHITYM